MDDKNSPRQTHFEQVPLETIKTILLKDRDAVVREGPLAKTEPYSVPPTRLTPRDR